MNKILLIICSLCLIYIILSEWNINLFGPRYNVSFTAQEYVRKAGESSASVRNEYESPLLLKSPGFDFCIQYTTKQNVYPAKRISLFFIDGKIVDTKIEIQNDSERK